MLHGPLVEDSTVVLTYHGAARRVAIPSDLNGWNPAADTMTRVPGTKLFYKWMHVPSAARFEYKFLVDTVWTTDPMNPQHAMGGHGPNSEVWMPGYEPPDEVHSFSGVPKGTLDTLTFSSALLGRTHPVYVYRPHRYFLRRSPYPALFVMDGGEYLSLGLMHHVLDNLIFDKRIRPLVAVFVDPRTDPLDASTSTRMADYTLRDTFVNALVTELRPLLMKKYNITTDPRHTAIMGASLGGLISTYASLRSPDVFGLCAAQSPSYWWNNEAIFRMTRDEPAKNIRFYIDTGTIRDAREHASKMGGLLKRQGYDVFYAEHPEGHNWVNWRSRIDDILTYFWPR
jgi:enterochelin esterase family protein